MMGIMDIQKLFKRFDAFQQKHRLLYFPLAVIKKFGEDQGGYLAALLTYYGFLALFPLLLVLVTILQLWFRGDPLFQNEVSSSVGHFFPLLGDQLQRQIHGPGKEGMGLVVGLAITAYGARGVASAFRNALDTIWCIPKEKRIGFPQNIIHDIAVLAIGLAGFAATVATSAFSAQLGHATWVKVLANIGGFGILTMVLAYMYHIATSGQLGKRSTMRGALIAGAAIQMLLTFGGIIMKRELQHLDSVYGTFAVVLGLLFWIYLLARVIVYAAEVNTVRHLRLYPRSTTGQLPARGDERLSNIKI